MVDDVPECETVYDEKCHQEQVLIKQKYVFPRGTGDMEQPTIGAGHCHTKHVVPSRNRLLGCTYFWEQVIVIQNTWSPQGTGYVDVHTTRSRSLSIKTRGPLKEQVTWMYNVCTTRYSLLSIKTRSPLREQVTWKNILLRTGHCHTKTRPTPRNRCMEQHTTSNRSLSYTKHVFP